MAAQGNLGGHRRFKGSNAVRRNPSRSVTDEMRLGSFKDSKKQLSSFPQTTSITTTTDLEQKLVEIEMNTLRESYRSPDSPYIMERVRDSDSPSGL